MACLEEKIMGAALKLASLGGQAVAPNPLVGAVVVKNGKIIGKGTHEFFGGPHAEINAIRSVPHPEDLKKATLYVTLEPCRHHGKTPPCAEFIAAAGVQKVIYGIKDPFQKGKRPKNYQKTRFPALEKKCRNLNKTFFMWSTQKRPYITVKVALSADGFVAGENGQSVRITNDNQNKKVHLLRASNQAILVGINTVINDNPRLNVRHIKGKDPLRIILDSSLKVPLNSAVLVDKNVLIATTMDTVRTNCPKSVKNKMVALKKKGINIWKSPTKKQVSLKKLFVHLVSIGIHSVLVEPGPTLYQALKKANLIDDLIVLRGKKRLKKGVKINL